MAKKERVIIEGIAVWPKLDVPDVYKPKKGPEKIRYTTDLKMESKAFAKFQKFLEAKAKELMPDVDEPKMPFKAETEKDKDGKKRETGAMLVTATSGVKYKPPLFDAKNKKLPSDMALGGGSKIKLDVSINAFEISKDNSGINLYINAVQVIDFVEKGVGKSNFEETDGFTFDGADEDESFGTKKNTDDDEPYSF